MASERRPWMGPRGTVGSGYSIVVLGLVVLVAGWANKSGLAIGVGCGLLCFGELSRILGEIWGTLERIARKK